ncbi:MAG: DUF433 domain-containing protein [Thermoplasmatales archaeon]|nr:DUF433 domain-containing protein [Thermoplasmatales archaeon]
MENRIEINPRVMVGKPVIKGTRIPVYLILDMLAVGHKTGEIIKEYPNLREDDIIAAIKYASNILNCMESMTFHPRENLFHKFPRREEIVDLEA